MILFNNRKFIPMYQKEEQQSHLLSKKIISVAINILSLSSRVEYAISVPLKKFSLTLPQFNTLIILAAQYPSPIVLKRLTNQMIDKSSNTSRLVDKLSEKNLVVRQVSTTDRRIIHVLITEKGLQLVDEASEILEMGLEKQLFTSEHKEMDELIECLKGLRAA